MSQIPPNAVAYKHNHMSTTVCTTVTICIVLFVLAMYVIPDSNSVALSELPRTFVVAFQNFGIEFLTLWIQACVTVNGELLQLC